MTKTSLLLILVTFMMSTTVVAKCVPQVKQSKPPRLVNGEWVTDQSNSADSQQAQDLANLKKKQYAFIFSGTYSKEASLPGKQLGFIQSKKIWQGKVPKSVDLNPTELPTDPECQPLKFGQDYVFFGKLGPRQQPIKVKEFRTITPAIKAMLGQPEKQWLRGRLINTPKK